MTIEQNEINKIVEKAESERIEHLKKVEKEIEFFENMRAKEREFWRNLDYKMGIDINETMREFDENEKKRKLEEERKRKYGINNNDKIENDFDSLEKKQENEFDSFEKWKEDVYREIQQTEEGLKIKRELEEERDGKYSINNNDKIENEFDLLEKEQENELDYKMLEDMKRDLKLMISENEKREKIEKEEKRKRIEREEREKKEERSKNKNILKNFRELLIKSKDNNYSSDRPGRIK